MADAIFNHAKSKGGKFHTIVDVNGRKYSVSAGNNSVVVRNDLMDVVGGDSNDYKKAVHAAYKEIEGGAGTKTTKKSDVTIKKLDDASDGSVIKITTAQTGSNVVTFTKKDGKWYSKNTTTRGEVEASSKQVLNSIEKYNKKSYQQTVDLKAGASKKDIYGDNGYMSKDFLSYLEENKEKIWPKTNWSKYTNIKIRHIGSKKSNYVSAVGENQNGVTVEIDDAYITGEGTNFGVHQVSSNAAIKKLVEDYKNGKNLHPRSPEKPYIYNEGGMVGGKTQIKDEAGLLKVLNGAKNNTVLIYTYLLILQEVLSL